MPEKDSIPKTQFEVRLKIENSIKLDPENPIPIQYGGNSFYTVSSAKGAKKYIPFIGRDDNMAQLLLEARLTSTTQNICISTISQSVVGKGMSVVDNAKPDADYTTWLKKVNNEQQSFDDVLRDIVDGERTYGNQFIEVLQGEINKKKFIKIYLHAMQYCRFKWPEEDSEDVTHVIISKLLARKGFRAIDLKDSRVIPLYSDNPLDKNKCWLDNGDGTKSTMLHLKNEVNGVDYYGLPASIAGLRYQVLEGKSAQYNIDEFENNMVLGGMLIFKSSMTTEEAQKNAKEILMSHVGTGKAGRISVISSESGLADVEYIPYETKKDGSYIELDQRIEQKIVAANGWDALLAGIHQARSSLGVGSGYVRAIYDIKEAVLLNPLRKKIIDKIIIPIMNIYADVTGKKEILKYEFTFQSSMPFSFMGDIDPTTFMKVSEARELAGMPPDEKNGDKYLSEMGGGKKTANTGGGNKGNPGDGGKE